MISSTKYKIVKINCKFAMYILQSRHLQSSPFQLLNFLLNTARFSDFFKLSGNACQSSEPRNDTDSIPYVLFWLLATAEYSHILDYSFPFVLHEAWIQVFLRFKNFDQQQLQISLFKLFRSVCEGNIQIN